MPVGGHAAFAGVAVFFAAAAVQTRMLERVRSNDVAQVAR